MLTGQQKTVIIVFLFLSVFVLFGSIIWLLVRNVKKRKQPEKKTKGKINGALLLSFGLIGSIWFMRFAVGYSANIVFTDANTLLPLEEFLNSLFIALRTFSMEEEYTTYVQDIRTMVTVLIPTVETSSFFYIVAVAYASVLNFIAPIAGGAIILEILAGIYPKIKLWWVINIRIKRKKCYFSKLNAMSLALAKSIYTERKNEKLILIFTDAYIDDEKEKEYELFLEAKQYGAICVRDDLSHVSKPRYGEKEYYLVDAEEFENVKTLMSLVEEENVSCLKNSIVYMFIQTDMYIHIEKKVRQKLESELYKTIFKNNEKPVIVPINAYRNLVQNLMCEVPLYEPLIATVKGAETSSQLSITILGNGVIGTEAFLNAYWFGQMMVSNEENKRENIEECKMTINVVSMQEENLFWSKIDYINPEIRETVNELREDINVSDDSSCNKKDSLLKYNSKGDKNSTYCSLRYIQADVKIGGFWDEKDERIHQVLSSDYFIVALGGDADNISVAEKLRYSIGKRHLESAEKINNTVIAYAVFDPDLAETLNEHKRYQSREKNRTDIYMHAFGCLEKVYSCDNVYMTKSKLFTEENGKAYLDMKVKDSHIDEYRIKTRDEVYFYWADLARAMHIKYKVFSLGWIKDSVFSYESDVVKLNKNGNSECILKSADECHSSIVNENCNIYKKLSITENLNVETKQDKDLRTQLERKKQCLAWLEHRRWNAFTRVIGYQSTTEIRKNLMIYGSHKNMSLKLHPCLIEAKKPDFDANEDFMHQNGILPEIFNFSNKCRINEENVDKKIDKRIEILNSKKSFYDSKSKIILKMKQCELKKLDLMDLLSYNWCKEATSANIERIEKEIQYLTTIKKAGANTFDENSDGYKKICFKEIKSSDYKKYDYYTHEIDRYISITELAEKLCDKDKDELIKDCQREKYKGAICFNRETDDWYIPNKIAKNLINDEAKGEKNK